MPETATARPSGWTGLNLRAHSWTEGLPRAFTAVEYADRDEILTAKHAVNSVSPSSGDGWGASIAMSQCNDNYVEWIDDADPEYPRNAPMVRKVVVDVVTTMIQFMICRSSTILVGVENEAAQAFGVNEEVFQLDIALYQIGLATGEYLGLTTTAG